MKTVAVIPCHNEAKYIQDVVSRSAKHVDVVCVVDNNSTDGTCSVASLAGAKVVSCQAKGMGNATATGIWATQDADVVVTLDGDGQHNPDEIPGLAAPVQEKIADIAIGVRLDNSGMPVYRRLGNHIIALAANLGACVQVVDAQCGFRALGSLARQIPLTSPGFGCVTELIIKSRRQGLRLVQVPVSCIYHDDLKANSAMNPVRHGISVLMVTLRWRLWEYFGL